jgi:hypothetical protein
LQPIIEDTFTAFFSNEILCEIMFRCPASDDSSFEVVSRRFLERVISYRKPILIRTLEKTELSKLVCIEYTNFKSIVLIKVHMDQLG